MQTLRELIEPYREPTTRMVGLVPNPTDHSCDNGLLFSATYMVLEGRNYSDERGWFIDLLDTCQPSERGWFVRYPGAGVVAHDDLTGIAAASMYGAYCVGTYGKRHWWSWGLKPGKGTIRTWWGRIVDFPPTVMAAYGSRVGLLSQILWSIDTMASCLTAKGNTSGKCLSYLKIKVMDRRKDVWLCHLASKFWRSRMRKMYPGGMRDVYAIYFKPAHPFAVLGPVDFY